MSGSESYEKSYFPLKEIPGTYGMPLIGAFKDRLDYFWFQGPEKFFGSRMKKYNSSVFRVNIPPCPPVFCVDPRVIILLDSKSFSVLFDLCKVEKKNVLTGHYMASTQFTGGYRMLACLDPSEDLHLKIKGFLFEILKRRSNRWIPEFQVRMEKTWVTLENEIGERGKACFNEVIDQFIFNFLCKCILNTDPADDGLGKEGPALVNKWLGLQLAPFLSTGLPHLVEEMFLHSFPLPFGLVRNDYKRLYGFVEMHGAEIIDMAEQQFGLNRDEACHNIVFIIGFNAFGGLGLLFPSIVSHLANAGAQLHKQLAEEIREAVKANGGLVTLKALADMSLVQSTVCEVLRLTPPVPLQYGRAKIDFVLESHDSRYRIKKGDLLGGYQPFATRDPTIFHNAHEFIASRFLGEEGQKLIKHVMWSNGPETQETSVNNKQCGGKNLVVLMARLLIAELFLRYDSFNVERTNESAASKVVFTSFTKRSF